MSHRWIGENLMNIQSFLQVLCGLAFFLYGMSVMSSALEKMAGGKLESAMKRMTESPLMSFLLGLGITIAIQSSSGTMVMLVGLVNSGIIAFEKTLPIILGSNVGTTFTGWLLSLTSVGKGEFSIWTIMNPDFFAPILAFCGILLRMTAKKEKHKDIGTILIGFTILMTGMNFMSDSMSSLSSAPWFANMLVMFENPIAALLTATIFTGLIQSSAATIGIVEAFAVGGTITYQVAIPLVLGANIGTCITGVIGAIGTNTDAKRVAFLQVLVNTVCAMVVLAVQVVLNLAGVKFLLGDTITPAGVAMVHTLFNILNTMLSFLLSRQLLAFTMKVIKDHKAERKILIDERLLANPSIAISEALARTKEMASMVMKNINAVLSLEKNYSEEAYNALKETENLIDWYQDELDNFLVKLARRAASEEDSKTASKCLHVITDFERIGDHAMNLADICKKMNVTGTTFTEDAMAELKTLQKAMKETLDFTFLAFENEDSSSAAQVEPLEEVTDVLISTMMDHHIARLTEGKCGVEQGFMWPDYLNNVERICDHCSNIAASVIETEGEEYFIHQYLHSLKHDSESFRSLYAYYLSKYQPEITG